MNPSPSFHILYGETTLYQDIGTHTKTLSCKRKFVMSTITPSWCKNISQFQGPQNKNATQNCFLFQGRQKERTNLLYIQVLDLHP